MPVRLDQPVMTPDAVRWAACFATHVTKKMLYEAQFNIAEGNFDRLKKRAIGLLAKHGGRLDHSRLLRGLSIDASLFKRIITTLLMCDQIEVEALSNGNRYNGAMTYEIEAEDIPEEDIPRESARFLLQTYHRLDETLKQPMLRDRRGVLGLARYYLFRVLAFVPCDCRYHPGDAVSIDARRILRAEGSLLPKYVGWLTEINLPLAALGDDLRILHVSADVFFDFLQNIFDLKESRKCRTAFVQKTKNDPFRYK